MFRVNKSRTWWMLAMLALLVGVTAYAQGEKSAKGAKTMSQNAVMSGTLIDTKCYAADHSNIGNDHGSMKGCGTICANQGIPVGLLVDGKKDGRVVILLVSSKALANYVGQTVRVTSGKALSHDAVVPDKVEVKQDDGSFKEVDISGMS